MLVGPSGCGKTTTMRMVNRLVEPTSGRILVGGEDVTRADPVKLRRGIGYVIQQVGLFPHQTIAENVATVPRLLRWSGERIDARVTELLTLVRLGDRIVIGRQGLRVFPAEVDKKHELFEFMASPVSSEKPKGAVVREIAAALQRAKEGTGKILVVAGPAIVPDSAISPTPSKVVPFPAFALMLPE